MIPNKLLILPLIFLLASCQTADLTRYSFTSRQMGVDFRIDLYAADKYTAEKAAEKAFNRISELNQIMSDYLVDSELWKLSESSGQNKKLAVSQDLWKVLKFSQKVHRESDGAFDITAGPYIFLWRKARVTKKLPTERSMARAANKVGMNKIILNKPDKTVELTAKKMRLDLGGIAKGYAADEALKVLFSEGIKHALVDGSGDIALSGNYENSWKVYISNTTESKSSYIEINSGAVATSGYTYQSVEISGKRYSHILDPRTGMGVTDNCTVTVFAEDCKTADAWASAVSVLGPQKGLEAVEKTAGVDVYIVCRDKENKIFKSSGFPEIIN